MSLKNSRNLGPLMAAILFKGEDYEDAVLKARKLILEWERQERMAEYDALVNHWEGEEAAEKSGIRDISFKKAVLPITGRDNETDATHCFRELRRKELRDEHQRISRSKDADANPSVIDDAKLAEEIENKISEEISVFKDRKVSMVEIEDFRDRYLAAFPRRRPKSRKWGKK